MRKHSMTQSVLSDRSQSYRLRFWRSKEIGRTAAYAVNRSAFICAFDGLSLTTSIGSGVPDAADEPRFLLIKYPIHLRIQQLENTLCGFAVPQWRDLALLIMPVLDLMNVTHDGVDLEWNECIGSRCVGDGAFRIGPQR